MKLAGVLTESDDYPLDNPPVMVYAALRAVLATCKRRGVEPVGAFEMSVAETWDGSDRALRWEFTPDAYASRSTNTSTQ